ncbi:MAG: precorrin-6Y-methylase [Isosphaeraceae bacterium]|jgi:precorrin-6Y C5,15-methyltransferase (decarboxylating)|nr:MAG: precorrin-6Y-methylase [Isosphaeraceae bacterium]
MEPKTGESKIWIVGIGDDGLAGLNESTRRRVEAADLLLGSAATLRLLDGQVPQARREVLDADMLRAVEQVRAARAMERPVLVSYGDPLFFGISRYLTTRLGKDAFEVVPHVSSMQLAFARIKESWDDAYLTSLEGKRVELVLDRIRTAEKVGLFASSELPPKRLARLLLDQGIDYFRAYVCEHLGQPDERVTQVELTELAELDFDPLHVLILIRTPGRPDRAARRARLLLFGNPDDRFTQSRPRRGLITQAEVRAIALAQLDLRPGRVVWDVGAGSGSVAIEAAQLVAPGLVYAIEPDPAELALIETNAERFGVANVRLVAGRAPESLGDLPAPDAVFVGGVGRLAAPVLRTAFARLKPGGTLVANVATIDALATSHQVLKSLAGEVRIWSIQLARGVEQLERVRFQAVNPTFLLAATKPDGREPGVGLEEPGRLA